ncbi:MAG: hypothetical protein AAGI52_16375 [Bacteroidota bacterium]
MLRLVTFLVPLVLIGCASPEPTAPEVPLTGSYSDDVAIQVFNGEDWEPSNVTNRLAVIERGDSLDVSLALLFTNAHICEWHGSMTQEDGHWTSRETLDFGDERDCVLRLDVRADSLLLRDEGGVCRQAYCGARGVLDGIGFARSTRKADTSWRDDLL